MDSLRLRRIRMAIVGQPAGCREVHYTLTELAGFQISVSIQVLRDGHSIFASS
jgi:hypothetical protein